MKPDLIRHLEGENLGRFPVWMMRQAGRYLPDYRKIREKHTFWEMVTTPELAVRVSAMPLETVNVDAVIFFSDILSLPYGLGMPIEMKESIGPVVVKPLAEVKDFNIFSDFSAPAHTKFVGDTLKRLRAEIPKEKTLIGFAGSPWTVGCYLIQGQGKNEFEKATSWMKRSPDSLSEALEPLTQATIKYLEYQIDSGADIVQLFDTWLPKMSTEFFSGLYLEHLNRIFRAVRKKNVPVIYFAKGLQPFLDYVDAVEADVISVGCETSLSYVDKKLKGKYSLQGNLDPELLKGDVGQLRKRAREIVAEARGLSRPPIMNLGHGIMPTTPVENAQAYVDESRALWI